MNPFFILGLGAIAAFALYACIDAGAKAVRLLWKAGHPLDAIMAGAAFVAMAELIVWQTLRFMLGGAR